jgi:hypothetical protein
MKVNEAIVELFNEYKRMNQPTQASDGVTTSLNSNSSLSNSGNEELSRKPRSVLKSLLKKQKLESGTAGIHKSELDIYLGEAIQEDKDDFDILKWWKINSERFLILSQMAQDILAIPISIVALEFAFSTRGRILVAFRSSLTLKIAEALIYA